MAAKTAKLSKRKAKRKPVGHLTPDEVLGILTRRRVMEMQADRARHEQALAVFAAEAYDTFVTRLRDEHELPTRYEVDDEGNVFPDESPPVAAVAGG
jgi:hypothetical protein